jgi:CBS domain-containing protein
MKISAIMKSNPKTLTGNEFLVDAARIMKTDNLGILPIVENGTVIGVITDRDIVTRAVAGAKSFTEYKVKDIMSKDIKACNEDDDVSTALNTLGKAKIRRLPVVNSTKKLVGIVTLTEFATSEQDKALLGKTLQQILS